MSECMLAMQSDAPVRLAAASPEIVLGDPKANAAAAISAIRRAEKAEADYLVLPELFLCGATLGSLMEHPLMLNACREALGAVAEATMDDMGVMPGEMDVEAVIRVEFALTDSQ